MQNGLKSFATKFAVDIVELYINYIPPGHSKAFELIGMRDSEEQDEYSSPSSSSKDRLLIFNSGFYVL